MTVIVLAGGKSLRLGRNKAVEQFGDKPLIQHVIDTVSHIDKDILVVTASHEQLPSLAPDIKIVVDCYNPGSAAIIGLYTGLKEASSPRSLVVACDMPYLNVELLRYIIKESEGFDATMPRIKHFIEPLHAVYSKNCLEPLLAQIESGDLKIFPIVTKVDVRFIEEEELNRFDPQHLSFLNVNYEHDLKKARELMDKVRK